MEEESRIISFTPREIDIVSLLVQKKKRQEIADSLGISIHTVNRNLERVYDKLGVDCRAAAAKRLHRLGIAQAV